MQAGADGNARQVQATVPLTLPTTCASGRAAWYVERCYSMRWNASQEYIAVATATAQLQFWCAITPPGFVHVDAET